MRLGILNEELGITVIDGIEDLGNIQVEKIKKQMPNGANLKDLAFFYMYDRDWIVLNKSHKLYEYYSELITISLELSEKSRKEAYAAAPTDSIRAGFDILEEVIKRRRLIYGKAVC